MAEEAETMAASSIHRGVLRSIRINCHPGSSPTPAACCRDTDDVDGSGDSNARAACVFENPNSKVRCSLQVFVSADASTGDTCACARAVTFACTKSGHMQLGEPVIIRLPHGESEYLDDFYRSFAEYKNSKGFVIIEGDQPPPPAPQSPTSSSEEADSAKKDVDIVTIAKCFRLPISAAARRLGVGETWLKQKCRQHNICRWPYRKVRSIEKVVEKLEAQLEDPSAGNTANRISAIKGQIEDLFKARDRICTGQVDEGSDDFDAIQATVAAGFGQFEESCGEDSGCSWPPQATLMMPHRHEDCEGLPDAVSSAMDCDKPRMDELLTIPCHIDLSTPPSVRDFPALERFTASVVPPLHSLAQSQQISLSSWNSSLQKAAVVPAVTPTAKASQKQDAGSVIAVTPVPVTPPRVTSAMLQEGFSTPPRPFAVTPPKLRAPRLSSPWGGQSPRSPLTSRINLSFASPNRKGCSSPMYVPSLRDSTVCCNLFGSGNDDLAAFAVDDDDFAFLLADEPPIPHALA
mmetsp:Transcript_11080/g.28399  ORF Transcript_11080/g.28399 Transcript_11080/m.28399 type:complete len:519 (+) Transcript_11080:182-1738(+)